MKAQLVVLAVVLAAAYAAPSNRKSGLLKTEQCDGTQCPAGCCPNVGWYCCPDDVYCAATPKDCPVVKKVEKLASLATKKTKQCDGTQCPGGCCPNVGWYCCPDGIYCAATPADCPVVKKVQKLASLATKKTKQGCDGTQCPAGCCPNVGWYCCPDDTYCAATPADCPVVKKVQKLASLATKKTKQCDGTQCPGGCCPNVGWYCCPDGIYCAATPADCPVIKKAQKLASLATKKTKQCDGTQCPGGCCPNVGWYCCPDDVYCAATPADCPVVKKVQKLALLATKKTKQGCDGTQCPAGCCPNVGWYCCPDDTYCAATPADCPVRKLAGLFKF